MEKMASPLLNNVIPVFLLCDVSESMGVVRTGENKSPIEAMNSVLEGLMEGFYEASLANAVNVAVCLITFNHEAKVVIPPTAATSLPEMPELVAESITDYEQAFRTARQQMRAAFSTARELDFTEAYRPVMFFITDGVPTDRRGQALKDHSGWKAEVEKFKNLGRSLRPRIYVIALGDAASEIALLQSIVYTKNQPLDPNQEILTIRSNIAKAIETLLPHLANTIAVGNPEENSDYNNRRFANVTTKLLAGLETD